MAFENQGTALPNKSFQAVVDGARKVSLKEKRRTGEKATSKQCKGKNCTVGKLIQEESHKLEEDKNKNEELLDKD